PAPVRRARGDGMTRSATGRTAEDGARDTAPHDLPPDEASSGAELPPDPAVAEAASLAEAAGEGIAIGEAAPEARGMPDEAQILGTRDLAMVRAMWSFLAPYKGLFFLAVGLLPLISACLLVQPWIIKQAIDHSIAAGTTKNLWLWVLAYGAAFVGEFVL